MEERGAPLALVDLLAALLAGALWYVRPELGPAPLLLVGVGFVLRQRAEPPVEYELTALDVAVALFLVSAGIGLLIAYDWNVALSKFYVILGGVAIYGALVRAPAEVRLGGRTLKPLSLLLGALPSVIAAYFVLTADYSLLIGKLPFLDGLFTWLTSWQPGLPGHKLHPNVAGGLIAALLPLQVLVLAEWRAGASWRVRGVEVALLGITGLGLALSASRGAWLALAAVAVMALVVSQVRFGRPGRRTAVGVVALVVVLALAVAPGALAGRPSTALRSAQDAPTGSATAQDASTGSATAQDAPTGSATAQDAPTGSATAQDAPTGSATAQDASTGSATAQDAPQPLIAAATEGRAGLLGNSLALAWDYAFTGLGLGGFQMAFSTYVLLLHVGHTIHSHDLFLNIWLEQGLLGLAAFVWLLGAAVVAWRRVRRPADAKGRAWAGAALATIGVIVLHGLVDDAFYGSRGVLLLLVPFALLTRTQADAVWSVEEPPTLTEVLLSRNGLIAASALVMALLVGLLPSVRGQVQANLGALAQTRAELSVYRWPDWPIQDALRRSSAVDLNHALVYYERALALDRENATANRRLGQIALSRGGYPAVGPLLASAYRNGYTNRATRQLYGEWLAIQGRTQEAAALWRTVDLSQGQIDGRVWWYGHIGEPENAAAVRAAETLAGQAGR